MFLATELCILLTIFFSCHYHSFFFFFFGAQLLSRVQLFVTLWTVAYQAPLSMGFFQQEY